MLKEVYLDLYNKANENASNLLNSANILYSEGCFPQAYALAFTALEEISKAQLSADVFTGLCSEEEFKKEYRSHLDKISNVKWVHIDASSFPYKYKWYGPDDFEDICPKEPTFEKRQKALFVDVNFDEGVVSLPAEATSQKDAEEIIHLVEVAFERIREVTGEFGGMQIGTKGFMK